jgi:hypothetical protein
VSQLGCAPCASECAIMSIELPSRISSFGLLQSLLALMIPLHSLLLRVLLLLLAPHLLLQLIDGLSDLMCGALRIDRTRRRCVRGSYGV